MDSHTYQSTMRRSKNPLYFIQESIAYWAIMRNKKKLGYIKLNADGTHAVKLPRSSSERNSTSLTSIQAELINRYNPKD